MKITRTFQVDPELYEQLERLAIVKKQPKGALIGQAIAQLVESEVAGFPQHSASFVNKGLEASA